MDKPEGDCMKESGHRRTNVASSHSEVESKETDLIEIESRTVVTRTGENRKDGELQRGRSVGTLVIVR